MCRKIDNFGRFLETEALRHFIQTILQASFNSESLKENPSAVLAVAGPTRPSTPGTEQSLSRPTLRPPSTEPEAFAPTSTTRDATTPSAVVYHPSAAFILEVAANVVLQNRDRAHLIWDIWIEHVRAILKGAGAVQVILVERAVASLFRLCSRLVHKVRPMDLVFNEGKLLTVLDVLG